MADVVEDVPQNPFADPKMMEMMKKILSSEKGRAISQGLIEKLKALGKEFKDLTDVEKKEFVKDIKEQFSGVLKNAEEKIVKAEPMNILGQYSYLLFFLAVLFVVAVLGSILKLQLMEDVQLLIFYLFFFLLFAAFFGRKLYKSLTEKERRRQEKAAGKKDKKKKDKKIN